MVRPGPRSLLVALPLLLAVPAWAQRPVSIAVERAGSAASGVDVRVLVDGQMWSVGTTGGDGRVVAPGDLVGLVEDDLVAVREVACRSATTLLLVPPDALGSALCPEGCECASRGAFLWGEDVRVDLAGAGVIPNGEPAEEVARPVSIPAPFEERPPPGGAGITVGPRWTVAAGGGVAVWPNLDLACGSAGTAAACDLGSTTPVVRASVELEPWPELPVGVAVDGGLSIGLEVDQAFPATVTQAGGPARNVVETDVWSVAGYGVGHLPVREDVRAFLGVGYVWSLARANVTTSFPGGLETDRDRDQSGGRIGGRAGLDWRPRDAEWGVRLEVGGMVGEEDDILSGWHAAALALIPLGNR